MKILSCYNQENIINYKEIEDMTEVVFGSKAKDGILEIMCHAEIKQEGTSPILYQTNLPVLIVARDITTGEEYTLFDEAVHGYDAIMCNDTSGFDLTKRLPLVKIADAFNVTVTLCYSIDYDEEKDDYDFDENGKVKTDSGAVYDWEYLKMNGIDWIEMFYTDLKGKNYKFLDLELC
jgi:hypothetical protein